MKPMVDYQVRTAFTFGDKDAMGNLDAMNILRYINSYSSLSFTYGSVMSITGHTFYNLPVHSPFCENKILFNVMLLDSNAYDCGQIPDNEKRVGCVSPTQVNAAKASFQFQKENLGYNAMNLLFAHQPLKLYQQAWDDHKQQIFGSAHTQVTCDDKGSQQMVDSDIFDTKYNVGLFVAAKDTDNNFFFRANNTQFMYALGSGFTGNNKTKRGALVFLFNQTKPKECIEDSPFNRKYSHFTTEGGVLL